jgi:hypothetical protein
MLRTVKRLLRLFMADKPPPDIHCLFPRISDETNLHYWCNSILGRDFASVRSSSLTKLEHGKATKSPRHEFLLAYITLDINGASYETCMIFDRSPAAMEVEEVRDVPNNASLTSLAVITSPSINSRSSSPSPSSNTDQLKAILGMGGSVAATDRVAIPKFGRSDELHNLAKRKFGGFQVLNTLSIGGDESTMSVPQLATLLEIVHRLAPDYTLRKHQCYWFALLVFLVVREKTHGLESNGNHITKRGKLFGLSPEHSAGEDEMVAADEYERVWGQFMLTQEVSNGFLILF